MKFNLLTILSIILNLTSCIDKTAERTGLEGKYLPDFNILLPNNNTYFNTSNIPQEKPFVIFDFNPSCPYCRLQTVEILEDINKLKAINFYFVTHFPITDIKKYVQEFNLNRYSNIVVGRDTADFINNYFEVQGVPYIAVYGSNKKLKKAFLGKVYSSQLLRSVKD